MWLHLQQSGLFAFGDTRILDIGPRAAMSSRLQGLLGARYVTGDLVVPGVTVCLDLSALPFREGQFNAIVCSHVLEHVSDDRAAMSELRRVLRAGGFALVPVPIHPKSQITLEDPAVTDPQERSLLYGQADHVRFYARADFESRLRNAGLVPRPIDVADATAEMSLDSDVYVAYAS